LFLVLYLLTTIYTLIEVPRATANFARFPWAAAVVLINVLAIANVPRALFTGRYGQAFVCSSLTIAAMVALFALALFPNILPASNDPTHSLTMYNAASSTMTLKIGLLFVAIGLPFILAYTAVIYWTFRGKVRIGEHSY
ncbi:MAG TPA: cytochrome d ubiquinol oxidase subunit II, partial [Candidatus Polarisedimenticolaceae bacterium]|nr:cytochrome d ubiquinol oxidase subunit II [Candidatus Polarisedimenticolaceae bacterium]